MSVTKFERPAPENSFFVTLLTDKLSIPDFCDMDRFEEIMKEWAIGTGMATLAVGKHGEYISRPFNFKAFCSELTRKNPEGGRRCIECDKKGDGVYFCHTGLVDFSAPITLEDGTVLGRIIGGQVLPNPPDEEHFRKIARELGIDEEKYVAAVHEVKIRTKEEIDAAFHLLTLVINSFVRASYSATLNELGLQERSHVIASLANLYDCDYVLDLSSLRFHELEATPFWHSRSLLAHNASELFSFSLLPLLSAESVPDYLTFTDLKTLSYRLEGRHSISLEILLKEEGWYRLVILPVFGEKNEKSNQIVVALERIDEEKKKEIAAQKALQDALEEATRANAAKTDFLSRMSHDIRTPLNGIVGMTYLAREEKNPQTTEDYLQKIDTSSKFLLGLINDVLDMAKVESNKVVLHPAPYTYEEFESYIDSVIRPLCEEKSIHFSVHIAMAEGYLPLQDKLRINQVIFNLLSNAVKFTPEGGKVSYSCLFSKMPSENKLWMHAEVSDTGIGMSEAFQKVLFTPFSQEGRSDTANNRGTGLGLAICKKMVDLMGGTITVKSQLGKGTTFIVEAPFEAVPIVKEAPKGPIKEAPTSSFLAGKRILVFEDHPLNQEIARRLLEDKGMVVDLAENGLRGLTLFKLSPLNLYDAILMDIRMPIMDGYEATRALRQLPREDATWIPIIAMTADAFQDDVNKSLAVGMNAHLAKPIDPKLLYATLEKEIAEREKQEKSD